MPRIAAGALALASLAIASPALAQSIDLLRGASADLAVSSAYRDRVSQVAALVDGDLETAWNSRTGELAGAWIEVRLPAGATVRSIQLTAGFTRQSGRSDLFTGNHRVSRVRVLRDGREVGVFDLDVESRALQTLPVSGAGGTYRIEVVGVVPGSRRDWREVCISELRVLGAAPGTREGQRFPRIAVGALPAPRSAPGSADRAELARQLRSMTQRMEREWGALNEEQAHRNVACMLDESEEAATGTLRTRRQRFLLEVAELVERVDELRAEPLRAAAFAPAPRADGHSRFLDPHDQDLIAAGFTAVVDWLADDEARCRWASAEARLRLRRAASELAADNHMCEHVSMDYADEDPPAELVRECGVVERALPTVEELARLGGRLRSGAPRLRRYTPPAQLSQRFRDEWSALGTALSSASTSCGWTAP